jgi:hypothetical protein
VSISELDPIVIRRNNSRSGEANHRTRIFFRRRSSSHWRAGGPGGQVVGSTDRDGGFITSSNAYTIEDYAASIFAKVGIDRAHPLHTPTGRPVPIAGKGRPIPELF